MSDQFTETRTILVARNPSLAIYAVACLMAYWHVPDAVGPGQQSLQGMDGQPYRPFHALAVLAGPGITARNSRREQQLAELHAIRNRIAMRDPGDVFFFKQTTAYELHS